MTAAVRVCVVCRRTRLSRYNKQQVCAPCAQVARQDPAPGPAGPRWPTWLWGSAPMRQLLARGELDAAMVRVAAELSQHELGELTGWPPAAVSLAETGRRDTMYDVRALLKFADAVCKPREALVAADLGSSRRAGERGPGFRR